MPATLLNPAGTPPCDRQRPRHAAPITRITTISTRFIRFLLKTLIRAPARAFLAERGSWEAGSSELHHGSYFRGIKRGGNRAEDSSCSSFEKWLELNARQSC